MGMDFKSADICRIIKECSKAGVSKLKLADIEIEFDKSTQDVAGRPAAILPLESKPTVQVLERQEGDEREALLQETAKLRQDQIEGLAISDPSYLEELYAQGELISADEESGRTESHIS